MKKFELTDETITNDQGITLHRIRATEDIITQNFYIKAREYGGFVETEDNLRDNAWIGDDAEVFGNAVVCGEAWVYGNTKVYDNALICDRARVCGEAWVFGNARVSSNTWVCGGARIYDNAWVYDNARIYGKAWVCGCTEVYGNARIYHNAWVCGNALIFGNARVYGKAKVCSKAKVFSDADISKTSDYMVIGPIGSRNDYTTFFKNKDGKIYVRCGCFIGDTDEFLEKVTETHGDSKHAEMYKMAAKLAIAQIDME